MPRSEVLVGVGVYVRMEVFVFVYLQSVCQAVFRKRVSCAQITIVNGWFQPDERRLSNLALEVCASNQSGGGGCS